MLLFVNQRILYYGIGLIIPAFLSISFLLTGQFLQLLKTLHDVFLILDFQNGG